MKVTLSILTLLLTVAVVAQASDNVCLHTTQNDAESIVIVYPNTTISGQNEKTATLIDSSSLKLAKMQKRKKPD